jgi:hypothetical protein
MVCFGRYGIQSNRQSMGGRYRLVGWCVGTIDAISTMGGAIGFRDGILDGTELSVTVGRAVVRKNHRSRDITNVHGESQGEAEV